MKKTTATKNATRTAAFCPICNFSAVTTSRGGVPCCANCAETFDA